MFLGLIVLALTFLNNVKGQVAIATFNNGVIGNVTLEENSIFINIDIANVNKSLLPSTDCWTDGLKYHVHLYWNHSNTTSGLGSTDCNSTFTGDHFDPWIACASVSGNEHCSNQGGCINVSDYSCNSTTYASNPFSCEVGDWSGKYGVAMVNEDNTIQLNVSSFWEMDPSDAVGKSIVFHCSTTGAPRAFCAPFELETTSSFNTSEIVQNSSSNYAIANFNTIGNSYIVMYKNGTYEVSFDLSTNFTSNCSSYTYSIYNSWTDTENSALDGSLCSDVIGMVYDPTRSCFSLNSDDEYCVNGSLCDSNYTYSCDPINNLYECSPSDLSGRWSGTISNTNSSIFLNGVDNLLIPLDLIIGKSIVIECVDDSTPIACAQITNNGTIPFSTSNNNTNTFNNTSAFNNTSTFNNTNIFNVTINSTHFNTSLPSNTVTTNQPTNTDSSASYINIILTFLIVFLLHSCLM